MLLCRHHLKRPRSRCLAVFHLSGKLRRLIIDLIYLFSDFPVNQKSLHQLFVWSLNAYLPRHNLNLCLYLSIRLHLHLHLHLCISIYLSFHGPGSAHCSLWHGRMKGNVWEKPKDEVQRHQTACVPVRHSCLLACPTEWRGLFRNALWCGGLVC